MLMYGCRVCKQYGHHTLILLFCGPQAIQHIEGTQEKMSVPEEEQRRAVIVTPGRVLNDTVDSDTASDNEGSEEC